MKRRNRFLVAIVSAAITFCALSVFAGRGHWHQNPWQHGHCYHHNDDHL